MSQNFANLNTPNRMAGLVIAVDPTTAYDIGGGFLVGDVILNTATGITWVCQSNTLNAAVWAPLPRGVIARLISANMNVTTDQAFTMFVPSAIPYRVTKVSSRNALQTTSISVAHGGIYTALAKGGTAIVADGATNFAGQTTTAAVIDLTVVTAQLALVQAAATALYLSLTAGQGAACTADLWVFGDLYF